jgi:hypothetical protein
LAVKRQGEGRPERVSEVEAAAFPPGTFGCVTCTPVRTHQLAEAGSFRRASLCATQAPGQMSTEPNTPLRPLIRNLNQNGFLLSCF